MCREDRTDEGEDCAADGGVEGPAQGAVSGFVGRCIVSTVVYGFLAAPASRVEDETKDEEQACGQKRELMRTILVCALGSGIGSAIEGVGTILHS